MAAQQGWNQQTPAIRAMLAGAMGTRPRASGASKRRKRKASGKSSTAKRSVRKTRRKSSRVKLVKGSAAAKAWGRKMRALRKRR